MSSTSLLSSLDCFTVDVEEGDPNFGDFEPSSEIQFNKYSVNDKEDDGVITVKLCQTEGRFGCEDDLAYVVRHPDYDGNTNENDVALIILPEDLPGDIEQRIANLPNVALNCDPNVPVVGQVLEAFGWGSTCEPSGTAAPIPAPGEPTAAPTPSAFIECPEGEGPDEIQTGTLKYLTNHQCNILRGKDRYTDDMLCARTDSTNGVAVGSGDSGGPCVDENNVQVGVVSFGSAGPGRVTKPNRPDGFARVSFFCDWIRNAVCADVPNDQVFCQEIGQPTTQPTSQPTSSRASKSGKSTKQAKAAN
ncbi:hypothetical protein ACHAW5_008411 [Stephanodiscus triporus]|uniref:Peptidase S1 domain-containing protein n=1 Tax=Stephanodiscus triporus TaxID=2934178 RepID=A0ABD3MTA4_9STRA